MIKISTSKGDILVQLHEDTTPKTVENFLTYIREGFYNDTIFHRVIDGFMIQGGGLLSDMKNKSTNKPIANEAETALSNARGTLAMARTMDPHSATAQFFINLVDNVFLDFSAANAQGFGYCVFGHVVEGMSIVDDIAKVKTGQRAGHADVPNDDIFILSIEEVA